MKHPRGMSRLKRLVGDFMGDFMEDLFSGEGLFKRWQDAHSWYGWLARIAFGLLVVLFFGGMAAFALIGGPLALYERWARRDWVGVLFFLGLTLAGLVVGVAFVGHLVEQFLARRRR